MEKINLYNVEFKCPHCGFTNKYKKHEVNKGINREFVYCSSDEGGCDKELILVTKVEVKSTLEAVKLPKATFENKP